MQNRFFELLDISAGLREDFTEPPRDAETWEDLYAQARKQSLLGITFEGVDRLHARRRLPLRIYAKWAMAAEKITERNRLQLEQCRRLYADFSRDGFRTCVLKGQGVGALYPNPLLRQSGDVDLWVEGSRDGIVRYLKARCPVRKIVYHHLDADFAGASHVEVHFTPSWMNAWGRNRRLQRYFAAKAPGQFAHYDEALGFCVPTPAFNAVYILLHIYRHVLEEGVGLRQLLDYAYVLQSLPPEERDAVRADLRSLSLASFSGAVAYVLQQIFHVPQDCFLFPPDGRSGRFLLEEVLLSGNFGQYDSRNAHDRKEGPLAHTFRKVRRGFRFFFRYPGEVLWMPAFMLWQYLWRWRHHYLYKGR
ncbi:MAG: nucleotidyltransferase family protein [Bacteroidales bacterium]|nr:nucleotidyltransferase family protein [Bacteroidales bacterium]